jgi:uncharacterized protein YpiB (UPF0302 family)
MTESLQSKKLLIQAYLAEKSFELDSRGRDFLELLLHQTALLGKMHFTKNAYYIRDRVLVGTSRYYSPSFYFRFSTLNINIENIFPDDKNSKFRHAVTRRNSSLTRDMKPEHIFHLLEKLPYWFLQIDEDFADLHHIGEGFTTQRMLETPALYRLLHEAHKSVMRKENRRRILMKHIDICLANGDKHLFMRLTERLKKLSC